MNIWNFFKGLKEGSRFFGEHIAIIINTILLSFVYIVGAGLTSITAKIFNKHFLEIPLDKTAKTYWSELNLEKKPINEYYRQF